MLSVKDINLLQAQNEGLKKQNAELQKENAELKAENERLLEQKNNVMRKNIVFYTTLQEIKAIVCSNYEIIDTQGRKDILKLITKAESEG